MRGETSVSADVSDVPDQRAAATPDVKSEHITEVSRRATPGGLENILGDVYNIQQNKFIIHSCTFIRHHTACGHPNTVHHCAARVEGVGVQMS